MQVNRMSVKIAQSIIFPCAERSTAEYFGHMRDFSSDIYFRNYPEFQTGCSMEYLMEVKRDLRYILEKAAKRYGLTLDSKYFVFDVTEPRPPKRWSPNMRYQVHIQVMFRRARTDKEMRQ